MMWHWLTLSKFFGNISNFFYYKHVATLKKKQALTK
jgi:hypothetical protein